MTHDILVALVAVGFPALALGLLIAPLCGQRYAGWALGPVAALGMVLLACRAASTLGVAAGATRTWLLIGAGVVALALCLLRRRRLRWLVAPGLAAAVVLALLLAPIVGRGAPVILGYNIANDSAFHASVSTWLADGQPVLPVGSSASNSVGLTSNGYPLGSHELVALAVPLADNGVIGVYQPVLAVVLALGAFVAFWAVRRSGARPGLAAVAGVLAAAGYLQYEFYSQAFLPQMAATPFLFGAIGLGVEAAISRRLVTFALALITALAAIQAYSVGLAVYLAPALAACVLVAVVRSARPWRTAALVTAGGLVAFGVVFVVFRPLVDQAVDFIRTSRSGELQGENVAGHLPGPSDRRLIWGSWIGSTDFRYPYLRYRVTEGGIGIAVALACVGLAWTILRRRLAVPLIVAAGLLGYLVISRDAGIYYTAKSYQVLAFPLTCAVVAGVAAFVASDRLRLRVAGAIVGGALLAGYSVAAWRSLESARAGTTFSNPELGQLRGLAAAGGTNLGLGLVIDDLAKSQDTTIDNRGDQQYAPLAPGARVGRTPTTLRVLDLDQFPADVLDTHDHIVERRLGGTSMPGPPYRLAAQTDDFRVWRRPPGALTSARRPVELPGAIGGVALPPGRTLGLADARWRRVRIGVRPLDGFLLPLADYDTTGTIWRRWETETGHYVSAGNGGIAPLVIPVEVDVAGPYRISVVGAAARPFRLVVDGERVLAPPVPTSVEGRDGAQYLGTVDLARGRHRLALVVGLMTVERDLSFVSAISLERDPPAPPAPVCVDGRRYEVAWDRPLEVESDEGSVSLENCGETPLFVDWVEPLPG